MSPPSRHRRIRPALAQGVVWLLLVALPLCGLSVRLLEMLGPRHLHHAPVASAGAGTGMAGWHDFRRGGVVVAAPATSHTHRHGLFERHRHDPGDPTVVALDGPAGDLDGAGVALEALAFAVAWAAAPVPASGRAPGAWPHGAAARFRSRAGARLDRPPCA